MEHMPVDYCHNLYASRRSPVMAPSGVVATSQPLAAQAGVAMLQRGGTAVDAILATAIALTVVEAPSNGIGGDAFALVWDGSRLQGANGSGRSPAGTHAEALRAARLNQMPQRGWWPVTVPGAPRAWADLHARYGRLPFADLFGPAIQYAERGFPVSPLIAAGWDAAARSIFAPLVGPEFRSWCDTFAPGGRAPAAGETWSSRDHAATLRAIAASHSADFYEGALATRIDRFARDTGGTLRAEDLAAHHTDWVDPIGAAYRGYDVWEIPPNGQGIAALMGLQILSGFDLAAEPRDGVVSYHRQIEATKLALTDARGFVADLEHSAVPVKGLLDPAYAASRRALIGERALCAEVGRPVESGTVYLCAADADGMMVSYIQSNFNGFGSGIVVPGTGIALHNRGYGFTLEPDHPNRLAPGKRPYHTIIPGFLTRDGQAVGPFGVMGGYMQAQGHLQVMVNVLDHGLQPQAALDAPRFRYETGRTVIVEPETAPAVVDGLRDRGHDVQVQPDGSLFGRGQIIWRLPGGGYVAGSDRRADGCAIGY